MLLLDDNFSGIMASWVQAGCALATVFLAYVTLVQKKRIEQLTDVVLELKNQTTELKSQSETLARRYDLEKKLSIRNRIPFLEKRDFIYAEPGRYIFVLVNMGMDAVFVEVKRHHFEPPILDIQFRNGGDLKQHNTLAFTIITEKKQFHLSNLSFNIDVSFSDNVGNKFQQYINVKNGLPVIQPPEDIE